MQRYLIDHPNVDQVESGAQRVPNVKDFVIIVPILASTLAIAYDVGYFSGIDISLFTLFTISEHITFAAEASPVALVFSIMAVAAFFGIVQSEKAVIRLRGITSIWILIIVGITMFLLWLSLLYYMYYMYYRVFPSVFWFCFVTACLITFCTILVLRFKGSLPAAALISSAALSVSFGLGYTMAGQIFRRVEIRTTVQTDEAAVGGRLITSGERGLLVYNPATREIVLIPWAGVRGIKTSSR